MLQCGDTQRPLGRMSRSVSKYVANVEKTCFGLLLIEDDRDSAAQYFFGGGRGQHDYPCAFDYGPQSLELSVANLRPCDLAPLMIHFCACCCCPCAVH